MKHLRNICLCLSITLMLSNIYVPPMWRVEALAKTKYQTTKYQVVKKQSISKIDIKKAGTKPQNTGIRIVITSNLKFKVPKTITIKKKSRLKKNLKNPTIIKILSTRTTYDHNKKVSSLTKNTLKKVKKQFNELKKKQPNKFYYTYKGKNYKKLKLKKIKGKSKIIYHYINPLTHFEETIKYKVKVRRKLVRWKYVGKFKITAYSPCAAEGGVLNAFSKRLQTNRSLAVDPSVISLGSKVKIAGMKNTWKADDTGGAIKGRKLDICVSKAVVNHWNNPYRKVYVKVNR